MDASTSVNSLEEAAKTFLERDFNDCFDQLRHYDSQMIDICKFAFTSYVAIIGGALALYKYGEPKGNMFAWPAFAILVVAALFGTALLALVVRQRIYFVRVARYMNEHRRLFLKVRPLGFLNQSEMYVDPSEPRYFSWGSAHALLLVTMAVLNAGALAIGLYLVSMRQAFQWLIALFPALTFLVFQLTWSVRYLQRQTQRKKNVDRAESTSLGP